MRSDSLLGVYSQDLMKISELAVEAAAVFDEVLAASEKTFTRTQALCKRVDKMRAEIKAP